MKINRREFLKLSGAAGTGLLLGSFGFDLIPIEAYAATPPTWIYESTTICPFCACGCGAIVCSNDTTVTHVEGNPDHPINEGALCSKGAAMAQLRTVDGALNSNRITQPMYRAPGATEWTPTTWSNAISAIAGKLKTQYDNRVQEELVDGEYIPVNRCETVASLGGASLDNEECYLLSKLTRALGLVYIEHQARI